MTASEFLTMFTHEPCYLFWGRIFVTASDLDHMHVDPSTDARIRPLL